MGRRAVLVAALCLSLGACSVAGPNLGVQPEPGRPASARASTALYVGYDGLVAVYPPGKTSPVETITDGINSVTAMTFDSSGALYVASIVEATGKSSITVYAPGSTSPQQTITKGVAGPAAMVFDRSGKLYVANVSGRRSFISVYAKNGTTPVRTITSGVSYPLALVCDAAGRLIVANAGDGKIAPSVAVYAAGRSAPMQTIKGLHYPTALAVDAAGTLYVANSYLHGHPTIAVYSGTKRLTLLRTIKEPPQATPGSIALALDSSGKLYALLPFARTIRVYPPGATSPSLQIKARITIDAVMLAIDPSGYLYVSSSDDVLVFPPGETHPMGKIDRGSAAPEFITVGPLV